MTEKPLFIDEMLPCPFCGRAVDNHDHDTLYPSGSGWTEDEELGLRTYRPAREVPKDQWCWGMHCPESSGGCGARISGDNKQEAIDKWNRRA